MANPKGIDSALCALCKSVNLIDKMVWLGNYKVCRPCDKRAKRNTGGK